MVYPPARSARRGDLDAIASLLHHPGSDSLGQRSVAIAHPDHSIDLVTACFNACPHGAFISMNGDNLVGYANAIQLPSDKVFTPHQWHALTAKGTGASHDPKGNWLYVCRLLVTAGAGHQSLGQELAPLLIALKQKARDTACAGVAIALPFPGFRDRSGTTEFQRQCIAEGTAKTGRPHITTMGPSASINVALSEGFQHKIALPTYTGQGTHFALLTCEAPAL